MIRRRNRLLHSSYRDRCSLDKSQEYHNLAGDCWKRFQQSGKQEELDETIALELSALGLLPDRHPDCAYSMFDIACYLDERYYRWRRMEDLEEAIKLHRAVLTLRPEGHPDRPLS